MKKQKYHPVGSQNSIKIVERGKLDTPKTQMHNYPLIFVAWYRHFNKKWRS